MSATAKRPASRYARLMGDLWQNPKARRLSNEALGVLARAWSYAAGEMTDGRVPLELLEMWAKPRRWPAIRAELTARHPPTEKSKGEPFLSIADGAIDALAHDFTGEDGHNISADGWRAQKAAAVARVEKSRSKKRDGNADVARNTDVTEGACNAPETAPSLDEGRRTKDEGRSPLRGDPAPVSDRTARGLGLSIPMQSDSSLVALWAAAYGEAYRAHMEGRAWLAASAVQRIVSGNPQPTHHDTAQHLDALAGWLVEVPEAEREQTVASILAGAWADPWMRERSCPLASIAKTPARWLSTTKPAATSGPLPPSDASKFRDMSLEERRARLAGGAS